MSATRYEYYEALSGSKMRQATVKYRKKLDEYDLIEQTADGRVVDETLAVPQREQWVV